METRSPPQGRRSFDPPHTDPTYKEWKRGSLCLVASTSGTRILPTRNGNAVKCNALVGQLGHGSYLQGMETVLSSNHSIAAASALTHGSYLQGMETYRHWLRQKSRPLHGSYLQGMETVIRRFPSPHRRVHGSYLQGMETDNSLSDPPLFM